MISLLSSVHVVAIEVDDFPEFIGQILYVSSQSKVFSTWNGHLFVYRNFTANSDFLWFVETAAKETGTLCDRNSLFLISLRNLKKWIPSMDIFYRTSTLQTAVALGHHCGGEYSDHSIE